MANATVSRLGMVNGAGPDDALFLKIYSGEVLTAFAETNRFLARHVVRTIQHGQSAQFPATWKTTASYHTPGNEIVGKVINHNERVIVIDDLLISDTFIALIDEAKNHYDIRAEYSRQQGASLSRTFDRNVAQVGILAARASATVDGGNGGTVLYSSTNSATGLVVAAFDAAAAMDEKDIPEEDRYFFVRPSEYYKLVQSDSKLVNKDWTSGNGGLDSGAVFRVAGMEIVKTNNLPSTNVNTGPTAYRGDFSKTFALAMHRSAVGTVKLLDLKTEMEYDIRRQGTLIVAKYAVGHGILRPECAVEITTDTAPGA